MRVRTVVTPLSFAIVRRGASGLWQAPTVVLDLGSARMLGRDWSAAG
jgi:hypothetical protein